MTKRDYYEVLGLGKSATAEEIKRAYRKKAVELHPDKGGDAEKFKEVNEAYETLKDPQKRSGYDQFGHAAGGYGGGSPFGGAAGGFDFGGFGQGGGVEMDVDLGDIFGSFFGGGRGSARTSRGRDVAVDLSIDFKEAVFGTTKKINLNLEDTCKHCKGKRAEPGSKISPCHTCGGSGRVTRTQNTILGSIQHSTTCTDCQGRGEKPEKLCTECNGKGTVQTAQEINIKIPAGVNDGAAIKLAGKGEAVSSGEKGDLYIKLHVKAHAKFKRSGHDITSEQTIELVEAVLGSEIKVGTIDGEVKMKVPAGTQSGQSFKLAGHGVPYGSRRGSHIVTLEVHIPKKLNKKQKELLEEFAKASGKKGFWAR